MNRSLIIPPLCAAWLAGAIGWAGQEPSPEKVLQQLRRNTEQQVTKAVDYTCVETVDRTSYFIQADHEPGCAHGDASVLRQPFEHDRLRLDVAVSGTGEMFSWRGAGEFSSTGIESVVQSGAISSGTFIGYLNNVFFVPGVLIRYGGRVQSSTQEAITFNYSVPLSSSRQRLLAGSQKIAVSFHGSFVADLRTNQLSSLTVTIDHAPENSDVCFAEQTITYQVREISGRAALIPRTSTLDIDTLQHQSSKSQTEFSGCHAFRGESTVRYSDVEDSPTAPIAPQEIKQGLESVRLHALISTDISSASSYTGDLVRGTLQSPVKIAGTETRIRRGAEVEGVITRLAFRYVPEPHYTLVISIDKIIDGKQTYLLHTKPRTSGEDWQLLRQIYGRVRDLDPGIELEAKGGEFLFSGGKFHTGGRLRGVWVTAP